MNKQTNKQQHKISLIIDVNWIIRVLLCLEEHKVLKKYKHKKLLFKFLNFNPKNIKIFFTIKNNAPMRVAFAFTDKSMGTWKKTTTTIIYLSI